MNFSRRHSVGGVDQMLNNSGHAGFHSPARLDWQAAARLPLSSVQLSFSAARTINGQTFSGLAGKE